jgi:Phage tail sheath protein subtilisin-like domain/Phage tail sheath C-terminal domain
MAEALISPGVFLRENDQSQITTGPITVGAALIGPTVVGRKNTPTLITSYSEYSAKFGTTFISGGNTQEYLTSQAAYNYFQQGGTSLLVTRVASGSYTVANASVPNYLGVAASTLISASFGDGAFAALSGSVLGNFLATSSIALIQAGTNGSGVYYFPTGSTQTATITNFVTAVNTYSGSFGIRAVALGATASLTVTTPGTAGNGFGFTSASLTQTFAGGIDPTYAFEIETLSVGTVMNNNQGAAAGQTANGILPSGSSSNIRWQIAQADSASGYFTLLVRQGNDYTQGQSVLETWTNLSLDPNQNNYIAYVIGDQSQTVKYDESGQAYFQVTGSYPNMSNYIRISNVFTPTPNYLNPQGRAYSQYTASLPLNGSGSYNGSFGGATGPLYGCFTGANYAPLNLFEQIPTIPSVAETPTTNIQGLFASDYDTAINLLANKDAYVYNSIYAPGISNQNAPNQISALLSTVQNRGDAIAVVDLVGYNQTITTVGQAAQSYDNSYGATYYPWVQTRSTETGRLHFVPASTVIPGVYEYNDKVSAEWFAPAGLNRGGLPTVIQPEIRLTVNQRNTLYSSKVNPIAVFPGQGTVVYGQKTLQARASSLDRVNVRRLLIALKGYIGQIAQTLVFEQNTAVTRNKFVSQVNPYLEYVQQKQGLYAFRVVMDETNNTPDVIDRNLLVGAIYLQPTRTAEFIQLDFNILPTGVTFG